MMIGSNGNEFWELNGKRHRIDGPAVVYSDKHKEWWLNDCRMDLKLIKVLEPLN